LSAERYFVQQDNWQNLEPIPLSDNRATYFTCTYYKGGIMIAAKGSAEIVRYEPSSNSYAMMDISTQLENYFHPNNGRFMKLYSDESYMYLINHDMVYKINEQGESKAN
jgi:hypothetical protein